MNKRVVDSEKPKSKLVKNLFFFVVLLALTMYILFKDENPTKIWALIVGNDRRYFYIGILSIIIYHFIESVNLNLTLRSFGQPVGFLKTFKFILIGAFFSGITPAATGGQPMEVYYMHKEKIPAGVSTISLLLNLIGYQAATILFGVISFLMNFDLMRHKPVLIVLLIIGMVIYIGAFVILMFCVYSESKAEAVVRWFLGILRKIGFKRADRLEAKFEVSFEKYRSASEYVNEHPFMVVRNVILFLIQFLFYFAIAYFAYRSLGFSGVSPIRLMSLQALVFATVSGIPLPGAIGVSEGAFIIIFSGIYDDLVVKSATLLTRIINFYSIILVAAVVVFVNELWVQKQIAKERLAKTEEK